MTTLEILKGVRKLLNSPKRWIKGTSRDIGPDGEFRYCLVGAINKVSREYGITDINIPAIKQAMNIKDTLLLSYNDYPKLTYSGLRARLDRAIKRLEMKG